MFSKKKAPSKAAEKPVKASLNPPSLKEALHREAKSTAAQSSSAEENNSFHDALFQWETLEYIQHEKSPLWYKIALAILVIFVVNSLLFKNWSLALALVTFAGVYYYTQKHHPPKRVQVIISEIGIKVGNKTYSYSHIEAFWIHYDPPFKTLNFRMKSRYAWDMVIQLENQDPVLIRQFLCGQIPEWEGKTEHLSDMLLRILKL